MTKRHHPTPIDAVRSVVFYSMVIGKSFWSYNIREREREREYYIKITLRI